MNVQSRLSAVLVLSVASCLAVAADRLTVHAVNYPLAYFAQRIGGVEVNVVFPVPGGIDPAFWEPTASDIAGFQQADLILLNGADYAKWLKRTSLPQRKLVNTSAAFQRDYISITDTVTHQHGPAGEHSHAGTAFTTWLDFNQAVQQAEAILNAMVKKRPEHEDMFRSHFRLLEQELEALDESLLTIAGSDPKKRFMASHPVFQYLARRYQIKVDSMNWEPEIVPDDSQWRLLQQRLLEHQADWMIWEGKPAAESIERLRALGLNSLVFHPAANAPEDGDFISVMKNNIMELEKAFNR